jgi:3-oxoacyl-[acyl-carrier protein] reductase
MDLGLTGRRAIVTGASKGIGLAVAAELVAEGAQVAICSRNRSELEQAAAAIGGDVFVQAADVTDAGEIEEFVAAAAEHMGGVDVLVNNAGGANPGNFETLTDEDWHRDLDTKLFSQIRCFRAALPHLRRSPAARVININAVYAKQPDPAFFSTTVNRAACLNLNKVLAQEFGNENILVNSVNIGFVTTPQWRNIHRRRSPDVALEVFLKELATDEVPLGRFGTVDEVSGVVAFLAGSRASYITGAVIDVAGGMGKYV